MHASPRPRSPGRRIVLGAALALAAFAASLLGVSTAAADPATQLADADLFCGPGYATKVVSSVALPTADSFWITDPVYGGHYVILRETHYLADGLWYAPVVDTSGLTLLDPERTFGLKSGVQGTTVSCEVVSRFASWDTGKTVFAPLVLARVAP